MSIVSIDFAWKSYRGRQELYSTSSYWSKSCLGAWVAQTAVPLPTTASNGSGGGGRVKERQLPSWEIDSRTSQPPASQQRQNNYLPFFTLILPPLWDGLKHVEDIWDPDQVLLMSLLSNRSPRACWGCLGPRTRYDWASPPWSGSPGACWGYPGPRTRYCWASPLQLDHLEHVEDVWDPGPGIVGRVHFN